MKQYDLSGEIKDLRVVNEFSDLLVQSCTKLGTALKPFCFCASGVQQSHGVLDLSLLQGMNNTELTLLEEIAYIRAEVLKHQGVYLPALTDVSKKALFFDYMLTHSVCYIEIPKIKQVGGKDQVYFDKFLATKNLRILQAWTGADIRELTYKYKDKISAEYLGITSGELMLAKVSIAKDCGKATLPRNPINISDATCVPLYCLNAFQGALQTEMQKGILEFTFLKDNGTERILPATLSREIMMDYYQDFDYVSKALRNVVFFDKNTGGVVMNKYQARGYVQVPEIGSSKFDERGTRSLNLARILSIKKIDEVDRTFININLCTVMGSLERHVGVLYMSSPNELVLLADAISEGKINTENMTPAQAMESISEWSNNQLVILSTTFRRYLHRFMITHQKWFPNYTGMQAPIGAVSNSKTFGVGTMDF